MDLNEGWTGALSVMVRDCHCLEEMLVERPETKQYLTILQSLDKLRDWRQVLHAIADMVTDPNHPFHHPSHEISVGWGLVYDERMTSRDQLFSPAVLWIGEPRLFGLIYGIVLVNKGVRFNEKHDFYRHPHPMVQAMQKDVEIVCRIIESGHWQAVQWLIDCGLQLNEFAYNINLSLSGAAICRPMLELVDRYIPKEQWAMSSKASRMTYRRLIMFLEFGAIKVEQCPHVHLSYQMQDKEVLHLLGMGIQFSSDIRSFCLGSHRPQLLHAILHDKKLSELFPFDKGGFTIPFDWSQDAVEVLLKSGVPADALSHLYFRDIATAEWLLQRRIYPSFTRLLEMLRRQKTYPTLKWLLHHVPKGAVQHWMSPAPLEIDSTQTILRDAPLIYALITRTLSVRSYDRAEELMSISLLIGEGADYSHGEYAAYREYIGENKRIKRLLRPPPILHKPKASKRKAEEEIKEHVLKAVCIADRL